LACLEKGGIPGGKKINLKNDFAGYKVLMATPLFQFRKAKTQNYRLQPVFFGRIIHERLG
jgi:hypothetical protein